jgi:hypothetical protein
VNIKGLYGDALANAMMKSSTKAKRRLTLSLCSVGLLDETELETIPGAQKGEINITGVSAEIKEEFRAKEPIKQLSQETLGAIYDLMNAMEWGKTRKDAKLKLLETIGNEKALELMQTEYAKYKAEQSAKGGDDILL